MYILPFRSERMDHFSHLVYIINKYTCREVLDTLKAINFAEIQEQGFIPLYKQGTITDALHDVCGFRTDFQFLTKSKMRTIQKKSKGKE